MHKKKQTNKNSKQKSSDGESGGRGHSLWDERRKRRRGRRGEGQLQSTLGNNRTVSQHHHTFWGAFVWQRRKYSQHCYWLSSVCVLSLWRIALRVQSQSGDRVWSGWTVKGMLLLRVNMSKCQLFFNTTWHVKFVNNWEGMRRRNESFTLQLSAGLWEVWQFEIKNIFILKKT